MKTEDGFKSYDEVSITVVDGLINSVSPNPANNQVLVQYTLSDFVTTGYIQISDVQNLTTQNYSINLSDTQQNISLSGFAPGVYFVKLVVDGSAVDSKTIIKN